MIRSGEIVLIDVGAKKYTEVKSVLEGGIETPCIYEIYGCKKKKKNVRTAFRNVSS